jgi:hypothetical protein
MKHLRQVTLIVFAFVFFFLFNLVSAEKVSKTPPLLTKRCLNCHQEYEGMKDILTGTFRSRSKKAKTIQVKINNRMELVKYTPETTVENVPDIKALKEPIPILVHFKQVGPDRVATEIVAKPKMEVPEEQLISTEELAKLVALGPDKGSYTLVDSRPGIKYKAGHIPTSISIPFPKMKQLKDMLPGQKNKLLIFYCEGLR